MNHDAYSDAYLARILRTARTIAVVGASPDPSRPSYGVMERLISAGYTVIPINPGQAGGSILGQPVIASLDDLTGKVDMVDVFRNSAAAGGVIDDAIRNAGRLGISAIWLQIGVRDDAAALRAEQAGLEVVMDRCPKIELSRLGIG